MFCSKCGHKNQDGAKFCESCGYKFPGNGVHGVGVSGISKKHSNWTLLVAIGSALVILCFFLPWGNLTIANWPWFSFPGNKIASGPRFSVVELESRIPEHIKDFVDNELYDDGISIVLEEFMDFDDSLPSILRFKAYPLFYIIPLAGLFGLLGLLKNGVLKYATIAGGLIGLIVLSVFYFQTKETNSLLVLKSLGSVQFAYQVGFYGTCAGLLAQSIFGYLGMKRSED